MDFALTELVDQVMTARAGHRPMLIVGGGSKGFYGNAAGVPGNTGHVILDMRGVRGVVEYHPSELVITAKAGTPLADIESILAAEGQMLAFEPPHFGPDATLGGCISAGLAGPARMRAGGVRDFVLGATLLDSQGRLLSFGGQVVKNVAGYDVSRLVVGALGTLGVITQLSIKVVPRPVCEHTLVQHCDAQQAIDRMAQWRVQSLPISASAWVEGHAQAGQGGQLWLRLSGSDAAVRAARRTLCGDAVAPAQASAFWRSMREQTHDFFRGDDDLWRIALPPACAVTPSLASGAIEWGGAQRWVRADLSADTIRAYARAHGGHATLFRAGASALTRSAFQLPDPQALSIMQRLKNEFDPWHLFNPGRLYAEL